MKRAGRSQAPIAALLVLLVGLLSAVWVPVGAFAASEEGQAVTRSSSSTYGFSDVFGGEWYATDDILGYAVDNGLLTGYPDGRFGPTDSVVRGQVVTVLWRMAGEPVADSERFADVDYGQYYGDALLWAREAGVAGGYGGTNNFGPDDPVNREQLAKFVASFAELQGVDISGYEDLSAFVDAESVSDWAIPYLGWCCSKGVITGAIQQDGVFANPQANAERAQFAKIAAVLHRDVLSLGFVVDYSDGVALVREGDYLPTGDHSAVIDAEAVEEIVPGDVLVLEPSAADSDGMALKVTSVTPSVDGLAVTGVEPELSEVVDELDVSGSTSTASSIVLAPGVEMLDEDIELLATTGSTKLVDKSFKVGSYGTIKLTSTAKYSFDYSWGKLNEASVALESKVKCDWTAKAKLDKTIKLFDAELKTSVPGVSVSVVYYAVFSASGEVHVEASAYAEAGATYKGGKWSPTYDNGLDFAASISGGVSAGVAPTLIVNFLGIGLADAGWEIGGAADGVTSLRSSGMVCCDLDIWMYLDLVVGKRDSVLADLGIGRTFNILDRDTGPKWSTHLEDGVKVDECTWGGDEPVVTPDEPGVTPDEPPSTDDPEIDDKAYDYYYSKTRGGICRNEIGRSEIELIRSTGSAENNVVTAIAESNNKIFYAIGGDGVSSNGKEEIHSMNLDGTGDCVLWSQNHVPGSSAIEDIVISKGRLYYLAYSDYFVMNVISISMDGSEQRVHYSVSNVIDASFAPSDNKVVYLTTHELEGDSPYFDQTVVNVIDFDSGTNEAIYECPLIDKGGYSVEGTSDRILLCDGMTVRSVDYYGNNEKVLYYYDNEVEELPNEEIEELIFPIFSTNDTVYYLAQVYSSAENSMTRVSVGPCDSLLVGIRLDGSVFTQYLPGILYHSRWSNQNGHIVIEQWLQPDNPRFGDVYTLNYDGTGLNRVI